MKSFISIVIKLYIELLTKSFPENNYSILFINSKKIYSTTRILSLLDASIEKNVCIRHFKFIIIILSEK